MRIKVFKARTAKEAMARVKSELGVDAVILHTKRYRKGGFLGYKGKEMVEVTAAVEDMPKKQASPPPTPVPVSINEFLPQEPLVPKNVLTRYKTTPLPVQPTVASTGTEAKLPVKAPRIIKAQEQSSEKKVKQQEKTIQQLQQELDQMKVMLERVMTEKMTDSPSTISVRQALADQEVDEEIIQNLLHSTSDVSLLLDKAAPAAQAYLADYFSQTIELPDEGIEIQAGETKIVALIGATGVGKTTTIAKIAAKFVLEKGISAALITADTYRISAVEQLKTYSDIIGLPLEIVYSPPELKTAIEKHRDKQLILIDTAGRSQHNEFQLQELKEFLAVEPAIEKHLVLSATTKYKDAVDILRNFAVCAPDKILFTKTDETSSIGLILNLVYQYPITLSYLTNGQSVPDDIFPAKSDSLAEMLLR
ncbi:MAG: flagellar biosynthesis protein FlhF [Selenomonadaceae bacterium]